MCCGQPIIQSDQPSVPSTQVQGGISVQTVVAQVNAVVMNDTINSQRAAEAIQANFHTQNLGQNG